MTLRKRPRSGTGSPKVLFGEDKASSRPLISGAARNAVYGPGGAAPGAFTAEYLVVAGAGGGSTRHNGGGGAGGYRSSVTGEPSGGGASAESALSIALGTAYTITVGAGGAAEPASTSPAPYGNPGSDSVLATITSIGGGGGGAGAGTPVGDNNGGSGGGGDAGGGNIGTGTANQGFNGGAGSNAGGTTYHGGGGGGAGAVGGNSTTSVKAGDGGDGVESYITGSAVYRAGGGGGSSFSASHAGGAGGLGGGGTGGGSGGAPTAGTANTGGGGGCGGGSSTAGAAGGSGVVIIRVPSTVVAEFSAGVVYNYIPQDDFNVYEITAAGVSDTVTFSQGAVTTVGESLLFNDDDSAYLTRTPASAGDRKTWTWSGWVKRGNLGGQQSFFSSATNNAQLFYFNEELRLYDNTAGTVFRTSALFRDPSAWYHVVIAIDTTAATSSNRAKAFVNGKQVTDFAATAYPSLNADLGWNSTGVHYFSRSTSGTYFDGYLSDVYFIDGQALDPSRFGKQDADGIWQPITYTGSYGTNGFHLEFADNSTAAALGTDTSGNGNDWTPSGITTDDQVTDTPSVNWATFGVDRDANRVSLYDGNLQAYGNQQGVHRATFGVDSGKWYWEVYTYSTANLMTGIATAKANIASYLGADVYGYAYFQDGRKFNATSTSYGASWGAGDIIGVAFDADNWTLEFFKNGTSQGTAFTGITPDTYFPAGGHISGNGLWNFGQRPFAYTPPTGFQALNSSNLPAPTITDGKAHFQPALYTGNGTTQAIGGLEFSPDFVWIKNRSGVNNHILSDAVRGAGVGLASDATAAEFSIPTDFQSFDANGFTVGYAGFNFTNGSGINYVAWNWNAGGSTVTNNDGTVSAQVRANTDAGFSIATYNPGLTASGQSCTVGHGLNQAPELIITKSRSGVFNWWTFTTVIDGSVDYFALNNTDAKTNDPHGLALTNSTFTQNYAYTGNSTSHIAYCFHSVDGFSKFGSYTGNGSTDGPFVYTGFRPAFVMVKPSSRTGRWRIKDTSRDVYNVMEKRLDASSSDAEATGSTEYIDFTSNGFKIRTTEAQFNGSGETIIYMAFAENPFKTARAR